ncbi:hypothetical protein ACHAXA_003316 [Cyclostephanos tholiformis]|uniref:MAGE domain-containing protein n=1 Tax=Cyclostephanos tholiformis TaxID=382380 RepID=A0ABD3SB90_9STRA
MARGGRRSRQQDEGLLILPDDDDVIEDEEAVGGGGTHAQFTFSQIDPDQSQYIEAARDSERRKLDSIPPVARNRAVTNLSRMLLFKALNGDVIDKAKCVAEALGDDMKKERVQTAMLCEAERRLRDVFGFSVRRVPARMEDELPSRFGNRLYLINDVTDDEDGTHSLNIHSSHVESSVERGVLMMILAFAFCRGTSQVRSGQMKGAGKKTRWISEHQLYGLLHRVDENIPSEPPSAEGRKKSRQGGGGRKSVSPADGADGGVGQTPDIDALLERFVQLDYLLQDKIDMPDGREGSEEKVMAYAMGPRAAMEVGRKQVIYFCSNILDEQPDPTMLAEVDEDEANEEERVREGEGGVEEETPGRTKRSRK